MPRESRERNVSSACVGNVFARSDAKLVIDRLALLKQRRCSLKYSAGCETESYTERTVLYLKYLKI